MMKLDRNSKWFDPLISLLRYKNLGEFDSHEGPEMRTCENPLSFPVKALFFRGKELVAVHYFPTMEEAVFCTEAFSGNGNTTKIIYGYDVSMEKSSTIK